MNDKSDKKFFSTTYYHVQTSMYMMVLIFFTFKEYWHAACNMMYMYFLGICFKRNRMYHKSILSKVQNLFFTLKNLSLRKVQNWKVIIFRDWGLGFKPIEPLIGWPEKQILSKAYAKLLYLDYTYTLKTHTTFTSPNRFALERKPFLSELSLTTVWYLLGIEADAAVFPWPVNKKVISRQIYIYIYNTIQYNCKYIYIVLLVWIL